MFSIEYDAASRFIAARDKKDRSLVSSCAYDEAGRMKSCTGAYGTATIERDERGRIVRVADNVEGSRMRISYDDPVPVYAQRPGLTYSGRIMEVRLSPTTRIYLEYDRDGRLDHEQDGPLVIVTYHYDSAGRAERVDDKFPPNPEQTARYPGDLPKGTRLYRYDAAGRLAETTAYDSNDNYTYDAKGRLDAFRSEKGGKVVESELFDYCD